MGINIQTAKGHFKYANDEQYLVWLRSLASKAKRNPAEICSCQEVDEAASPAIAYVNHGRWVGDCPSGCGGAMLLEPGMPYMCGNCFNAEIDGKWRSVVWPKEQLKIEYYLERRSLAHTANWKPHETMEMLKAENRAHGIDEEVR